LTAVKVAANPRRSIQPTAGEAHVTTNRRILSVAMLFFLTWTATTWFFEGRIETLLRPDAVMDRIVYAVVVNLLLGIAGGIALLWFARRHAAIEPGSEFPSGRRILLSLAAGFTLGLAAYLLQSAPSLNPTVIANAFAQVLVVSAAEVVVCWAVVGTAIKRALQPRGRMLATIVAAVAASVLFGLYHYAHSAPFNTLPMVTLLSAVGLATSAFFFISRDVAGTIVFHNFLGTFGVVKALAAADALAPLEVLQPALIGTALTTAAVLAAGYALLRVRATGTPRAAPVHMHS
jgi:hypothetical protein